MKWIKVLLVTLVLFVNFVVAPPSWADRGKLIKSADYTEVTQAIADLLTAQETPDQAGLTPEEIQQKIAGLQFQKYILETAEGHAQCTNQTGKTLAIYAQPKKASASQPPTLYFLGNGQVTDDDFVCNGVYLPAGTTVSFSPADAQGTELTEPMAIKIVDGTQLIANANPDTGMIVINLPPAQTFKVGEGSWVIPTLAQADIDAQVPNAPQD